MSIESQKYFAAGDAGGGPEKGPDEGKESLDINQLQKDFEDLSKIERIERQDIEPHLDKVSEILQNEPESIRPKDKNGQPGGLIELKKDIPTILIPDLHGKREILLKLLNDQDENGITNLEKIIKGKIQMVFLGDVVHTEPAKDQEENQKKAQNEFIQYGKFISSAMDKEIATSFGTVEMIMKLKELAPGNIHYLRGDHEIQNESYGFAVGKSNILQSSLVKNYFQQKYGNDFLQKYDKFEELLPFIAVGDKFFASHTIPEVPFSKEEIINFHTETPPNCKDKKDFFLKLTMSRPSDINAFDKNPEQYISERFQALGGNIKDWIYYYGHTPDEMGWNSKTPICGLDSDIYSVACIIKNSQEIEFRNYRNLSNVDENRVIRSFDTLQNTKILESKKITLTKETNPKESQSTQQPEKPPEKTPEKENRQQQIKDYIDQASVIWFSKSLEPQEQVQRLKEYEQKIKNLIQSDISISWPDLFKMDYNQLKQYSDQISNKVQTTLEANKQIKEQIPDQILAKAKEAVEESKSKLPGQSNKDFWLGLLGLLFALLLAGMKKSIGLAGKEESKKESKK